MTVLRLVLIAVVAFGCGVVVSRQAVLWNALPGSPSADQIFTVDKNTVLNTWDSDVELASIREQEGMKPFADNVGLKLQTGNCVLLLAGTTLLKIVESHRYGTKAIIYNGDHRGEVGWVLTSRLVPFRGTVAGPR